LRLGDSAAAERGFKTARSIAARYHFNQVLFAVEDRLANVSKPAPHSPSISLPADLADIANKVRTIGRVLTLG
jgi:hypothetical protein